MFCASSKPTNDNQVNDRVLSILFRPESLAKCFILLIIDINLAYYFYANENLHCRVELVMFPILIRAEHWTINLLTCKQKLTRKKMPAFINVLCQVGHRSKIVKKGDA